MGLLKKYKNLTVEARSSLAYTVCSILQKSIGFITLPLFTRLMTTEQFGQYNVYTSWMTIFAIIITLNLPYGSFSTAMVKFEKNRSAYISTVNNITVILALVFFGVYTGVRQFVEPFVDLPYLIVAVMVLQILGENFIQTWLGEKRFEFKYKSVIILTLCTSILSPAVALVLVLLLQEKGFARIGGYAAVIILFGVALFVYNLIKTKKPFTKEYLKYAFSFNLPLIPYYFSQVIFNQSDRIMINSMVGTAEAGLYGLAYSLAIIMSFILNAINNAYVPWLYGRIREKNIQKNKQLSIYISILIGFLVLCVIWFAPEVILIMGGEAYMGAIWVVPPVALSVLLMFYTQLSVNVEFYYEEKWKLVFSSIGAAVVNIVLNYFCIKKFGYIAAGYTTLVSYVIFAVCNYFSIYKRVRKGGELQGLFSVPALLLVFAVYMILTAVAMLLYAYMIARIAVAAAVLIALIICRKQVMKFVNTILKKDQAGVLVEAEKKEVSAELSTEWQEQPAEDNSDAE